MQTHREIVWHADVWLGEAALALVRAADYDIPAMRRAAARAQQQLGDLERRRADCMRSAAAAARAYQQARPLRLPALLGTFGGLSMYSSLPEALVGDETQEQSRHAGPCASQLVKFAKTDSLVARASQGRRPGCWFRSSPCLLVPWSLAS